MLHLVSWNMNRDAAVRHSSSSINSVCREGQSAALDASVVSKAAAAGRCTYPYRPKAFTGRRSGDWAKLGACAGPIEYSCSSGT